MNVTLMQMKTAEVLFEELNMGSVNCVVSAQLHADYIAHSNPSSSFAKLGAGLIVDSGYSFTHAVPIFNRKVVPEGVVR